MVASKKKGITKLHTRRHLKVSLELFVTKNYLLHVCLANAQDIGFNNVTLIPLKKSELCLICTNQNI